MQQQQPADYDLLAVFTEEAKADAAVAKLHKEGFGDEEVYQLESGAVGNGQFRDHGPRQDRGDFFLQTKRRGPNPVLVVVLAIIFGLVIGGLGYVGQFAIHNLPEPTTLIVGIIIGLIVGAIIGLVPMSRVRGDIGQDLTKTKAASRETAHGARTVVALRFLEADNIRKKSQARGILTNAGGRIDRSIGKRE